MLSNFHVHCTGCPKGFESLRIEDGDTDCINISEQNGSMFDVAIGHIEDVLMGEILIFEDEGAN